MDLTHPSLIRAMEEAHKMMVEAGSECQVAARQMMKECGKGSVPHQRLEKICRKIEKWRGRLDEVATWYVQNHHD